MRLTNTIVLTTALLGVALAGPAWAADHHADGGRHSGYHNSFDHPHHVVIDRHRRPLPGVIVPSHSYAYGYRPYVFRPHFSLGFGIWAGDPVPYDYIYPDPAPVYGYPPDEAVTPGPTTYGGVTLEITPSDAAVYVDDSYAGLVGSFDGTEEPLALPAGRHHIEVEAVGFQTFAFDVNVAAGQVIPYRGDLQAPTIRPLGSRTSRTVKCGISPSARTPVGFSYPADI